MLSRFVVELGRALEAFQPWVLCNSAVALIYSAPFVNHISAPLYEFGGEKLQVEILFCVKRKGVL